MEDKVYKLVVTGTFNAGKTTFVDTISDEAAINTDKATSTAAEQAIKATTTIALDYGQVRLDDGVTVHLFGTPGQVRFDFMRDILARGMNGFVFLVDSTDHNGLQDAADLLKTFRAFQIPYLVAANKSDLDSMSLATMRQELDLPEHRLLIPCVATDADSVREVIKEVLGLMEHNNIAQH